MALSVSEDISKKLEDLNLTMEDLLKMLDDLDLTLEDEVYLTIQMEVHWLDSVYPRIRQYVRMKRLINAFGQKGGSALESLEPKQLLEEVQILLDAPPSPAVMTDEKTPFFDDWWLTLDGRVKYLEFAKGVSIESLAIAHNDTAPVLDS